MIDAKTKGEIARDFVSRNPGHPIKHAEFPSTGLPDPAQWPWCTIAVIDKNCLGLSNGTAWVRADGSAL